MIGLIPGWTISQEIDEDHLYSMIQIEQSGKTHAQASDNRERIETCPTSLSCHGLQQVNVLSKLSIRGQGDPCGAAPGGPAVRATPPARADRARPANHHYRQTRRHVDEDQGDTALTSPLAGVDPRAVVLHRRIWFVPPAGNAPAPGYEGLHRRVTVEGWLGVGIPSPSSRARASQTGAGLVKVVRPVGRSPLTRPAPPRLTECGTTATGYRPWSWGRLRLRR